MMHSDEQQLQYGVRRINLSDMGITILPGKREMMKRFLIHLSMTMGLIASSGIVAYLIEYFHLRVENILIVFVLCVLWVAIATKRFGWAIFASLSCTLTFNYFFTEPRHSLRVSDPSYLFSLLIFLATAFIVTTLANRLQAQLTISARKEELTERLFRFSSGLLNFSSRNEIVRYSEDMIGNLAGKPCQIIIGAESIEKYHGAEQAPGESADAGKMRNSRGDPPQFIIPIVKGNSVSGILKIGCRKMELQKDILSCMDAMLAQFLLAIEREELLRAEQLHTLNIEKERLGNNLLRSISHDLRTPLTAIAGGSEFILENGNISPEMERSLLENIHSDALWLGAMVENLLNMARIQEGRLKPDLKPEVVDEIIGEAVARIKRRAGSHAIEIIPCKEIIVVMLDSQLILQVLMNLLNNAIEHGSATCRVSVTVMKLDHFIEFSVIDNGGGIPEEILAHLFKPFHAMSVHEKETRRGVGLGLSICKAIIEEHGGEIRGWNNDQGGATFAFTIPWKENNHE
jgi:two-component system sensor histidine kinase KdpD